MSDYTELVKAVREHADLIETSIELYGPSATRLLVYDLRDAAAAIEALQAQLPKRGEWIIDGAYTYNLRELNGKAYEPVYRCSCCNRQTESYVRLDEPKMPEDADFPEYCPHCGAKMEVQE